MAFSDVINMVKEGWDRIVGTFLHGEQEEYGNDEGYYETQFIDSGHVYGYPQENQEEYLYERAYDSSAPSPYAGSYAQTQIGEEGDYPNEENYIEEKGFNNVVAFPGVAMDQMMERALNFMEAQIIQLNNRETCKDVIEALRNNASVMINMENIASDVEKQRCVDMLGGAAYTLNCQISKVSVKGVYFISPSSVQIEMDDATRKLNGLARANHQNQGYENRSSYNSQRPPMYQKDYDYEEQPMAVGYNQPVYAVPYEENQERNDRYGFARRQNPLQGNYRR